MFGDSVTIHDLTLDTLKMHESHDSVNKQILRIYIVVYQHLKQRWKGRNGRVYNSQDKYRRVDYGSPRTDRAPSSQRSLSVLAGPTTFL